MKKCKLLMIGNSYSDDTAWLMPDIAKKFSVEELEIGVLFIGACSLERHYLNAQSGDGCYEFRYYQNGEWIFQYEDQLKSLEFGIKFRDWDCITLQQASMFSGDARTYDSALVNLISYVKAKASNPNVKLVWNMTWAYADSYEPMQSFGYPDQATMYRSIAAAVQEKIQPNGSFAAISPTGTAIQNARAVLGDVLNRDGTHLTNDLGRYIAAMTMFCTVTDCKTEEIAFVPLGVEKKNVKLAKECVNAALANPYEVMKNLQN